LRFFLDNNLAPGFAKALDAVPRCPRFVHLREMFAPDTPDHVWLRDLDSDYIVWSCDFNIVKKPQLRAAWRESRRTVFFFRQKLVSRPPLRQFMFIVSLVDRIFTKAEECPTEAGFNVLMNKAIQKVWAPGDQ